jgi:hypothetical protein
LTSESCVSIPISSPSLTSVSTLSPRASFNDVELRAFCAFLPAVDPRANSPS